MEKKITNQTIPSKFKPPIPNHHQNHTSRNQKDNEQDDYDQQLTSQQEKDLIIQNEVNRQADQMRQKYGNQNIQHILVDHLQNKDVKKVFDSADYFMNQHVNVYSDPPTNIGQQHKINHLIKHQENQSQVKNLCDEVGKRKYRPPLINKASKKHFDSADYFLEQYYKEQQQNPRQ